MRRNVAYLRVSVRDKRAGKAESQSISNQRDMIYEYARKNGIVIQEEYVDDGISAATMKRPAMMRLLSDIEKGNIQNVIVKDITRFSRNYLDIGYYLNEHFPRFQVRLLSVVHGNNPISTNHMETETAGILSNYYCLETSQKVKRILNYKKANGICAVPRVPYGYKKEEGDLVVDREKAKIVSYIFREYKKQKSFTLVAKALNEKKIKSPGAKTWSCNSVKAILKNEMYRGVWIYGKTKSDFPEYKIQKRIPPSGWNRIENHHEKIISDELFYEIQEICNK